MDARARASILVKRSLPDPNEPQIHLDSLLDVRSIIVRIRRDPSNILVQYIPIVSVNISAARLTGLLIVLCLTFAQDWLLCSFEIVHVSRLRTRQKH